MGKLWLRLLGIGEEEEADLARRGFLKMLGGAAVVAAAPTYVFAPSGGWNSSEFTWNGARVIQDVMAPETVGLNWFDLNPEYKSIIPMLVDNYFKESPLLTQLKRRGWVNV